jgi:hypothetical protein
MGPPGYISVALVDPGESDGVSRAVDLHTKGWLPYGDGLGDQNGAALV